MSGLFISYRRQDAAAYASRLRDQLAARYGEQRIFLDMADLAPGADWSTQLHQAVSSCESMLVVMGPRWLDATDPRGRRRIDDTNDFIRSEIAAGLAGDKHVIPVLVGGAQMPLEEQFPDDIAGLCRRQALSIDDSNWDADMESLFGILDPLLGVRPTARAPALKSGRAIPTLWSRLGKALDVLLGHGGSDAPALPPVPPPPAPRPAPAPAPTQADAHDVFVSYSSLDSGFADRLVQALEATGRRCWIAPRDIPPGSTSWAEPIVTAIASSRLMLVLLSEHSIPSIEVLREVTLAADEKIPLLPVCLDDTRLSPGLRYFFVAGQRLDLVQASPAEQIDRILPAVERQLPAME